MSHMDDLYKEDEGPFSEADYQAVKAIALRNGGEITNDEIFSVTVRGYSKLGRIKDRLVKEGVIEAEETDNE
jgi:hypothetical protein